VSESELGSWGAERVAGAATLLSELVAVAVVVRTFADDVVLLGTGTLGVVVFAPVPYVTLVKALRESA
jgi:hypothetical protein